MLFIGSNAIMKRAGFGPEGIAVEAVETLRTFQSCHNFHSIGVGFFDGQHIKETTDSKISGQLVKLDIFGML